MTEGVPRADGRRSDWQFTLCGAISEMVGGCKSIYECNGRIISTVPVPNILAKQDRTKLNTTTERPERVSTVSKKISTVNKKITKSADAIYHTARQCSIGISKQREKS